jgi:hypothetical protein
MIRRLGVRITTGLSERGGVDSKVVEVDKEHHAETKT